MENFSDLAGKSGPKLIVIPFGDLYLNNAPTVIQSELSELAEQDRLANTAKAHNDEGLLGVPSSESAQEDIERVQFGLPANEDRRLRPCVGGVGITAGVHN